MHAVRLRYLEINTNQAQCEAVLAVNRSSSYVSVVVSPSCEKDKFDRDPIAGYYQKLQLEGLSRQELGKRILTEIFENGGSLADTIFAYQACISPLEPFIGQKSPLFHLIERGRILDVLTCLK